MTPRPILLAGLLTLGSIGSAHALSEADRTRAIEATCTPECAEVADSERAACTDRCTAEMKAMFDRGAPPATDEDAATGGGWWSVARYFVFPLVGFAGAFLFFAARKASSGRNTIDI